MKKTLVSFLVGAGVGLATCVGGSIAINNYYLGKPKIIHTLDGYSIVKEERDKSKTVFSYEDEIFWREERDILYINQDNGTVLDDVVLIDRGCDGEVDIIRNHQGISIREAETLEEYLKIRIGAKDAFRKADELLRLYKKEFQELIAKAEKDREVMTSPVPLE